MKKYTYITILLICLTMFLSVPICHAEQPTDKFTDLNKNAWYYEEVMNAYNNGIMVGISDTEFAPDSIVTREMFVTALTRVLQPIDMDITGIENYFSDLDYKKEYYYSTAVTWCKSHGIVEGVYKEKINEFHDKELFGLGQDVTREQIATFLARVLNKYFLVLKDSENAPKAFSDTPSAWAADAVETMRKSGLMQGVGDNLFAPKKSATRAEVAAILLRFKRAYENAGAKFNYSNEDIGRLAITHYIESPDGIKDSTLLLLADKSDDTAVNEDIKKYISIINDTPIISARPIKKGEILPADHYSISFLYDGLIRGFYFHVTSTFDEVWHGQYIYTVDPDYFRDVINTVSSNS